MIQVPSMLISCLIPSFREVDGKNKFDYEKDQALCSGESDTSSQVLLIDNYDPSMSHQLLDETKCYSMDYDESLSDLTYSSLVIPDEKTDNELFNFLKTSEKPDDQIFE